MEENKVKSEEKNVKNKIRTIAIILIVGVFVVLIMCYQMSINMKKEKLDESIKQGNFEQFEKYFESSINDKTDTKDFINMSNQVYESYVNREDDFDIKDEQEIVNKIFEKNNNSEIKDIQDLLVKAKNAREKYTEGLNKYNENKYNEAVTFLKEIKEDDYNYEEAKKLLEKSLEKLEETYKKDENLIVFKDDKVGLRFYYDKNLKNLSVNSQIKLSLEKDGNFFNYMTMNASDDMDTNIYISNFLSRMSNIGMNLIERYEKIISNMTPINATKLVLESGNGNGYGIIYMIFNNNNTVVFQITANTPDYNGFDSILESLIVE